ncbi:trace amine-associated receptor 4-like isoform X2 [Montipora foliosa]|uniref:trace amine-associated receptor 4-like isoform X2 n=1 Tax=Montipora foliosa TaxID=591990 RepID=UPI0035F13D18
MESEDRYLWTNTEKWCLAVTLGFLIIFGLCGNLLVTIVILRFKRLRRYVNSYLILNLAISDFLTTSISMPYQLATVLDLSIISHNGVLCKVGGILSYPFYISSTVTLVMLAIERHIAVSDPLRYVSRVTTRTISIMIAFAWFQAVFFCILFAILGNMEFSKKSLDCGVTWEGTPLWLSLLALIMNVVLPYLLLLIMSLRVLTIARKQMKRIAFEMSGQTQPFRRRRNVFSISGWGPRRSRRTESPKKKGHKFAPTKASITSKFHVVDHRGYLRYSSVL